MQITVHKTSLARPTQLVFKWDAIHNTAFKADWQYIADRKCHQILQNIIKENATCRPHIYQVGHKVVMTKNPNQKHGNSMHRSPQTVELVFGNGTVTVKLKQDTQKGGAI
jgi:hypothetical protein